MLVQMLITCATVLLLVACGSAPPAPDHAGKAATSRPAGSPNRNDVVIFALGLIDTDYRFGGKNPEAGLDCSGMVSYIYGRAAGIKIAGSAADIARRGRQIDPASLRPGDLVFFNTRNASFSHVGIYIGDDRFVHAPSTNGRVRIDRLGARYFARHFEMARTYLD